MDTFFLNSFRFFVVVVFCYDPFWNSNHGFSFFSQTKKNNNNPKTLITYLHTHVGKNMQKERERKKRKRKEEVKQQKYWF